MRPSQLNSPHLVHSLLPSSEYVPLLQAEHEAEPALEKVPPTHVEQVLAPLSEYVPPAQLSQAEASSLENLPSSQSVQVSAPAPEYVPLKHELHEAALAFEATLEQQRIGLEARDGVSNRTK